MELVQLENFATLAEHLHFRRAASQAGVSPSTLSRQIGELEADLGFRLFDRNRRQVRLTPAGSAFLVEVQAILHRLHSAAVEAGRIARGEDHRLRIGHGDAVGMYLLQAALPELRSGHPDLRFEVVEAPSGTLLDQLAGHAIDVALLRPPVHVAGVADQRLCDEQLVVALPAAHHLARRRRIAIDDLATEALVVPPRASAPGAYDAIMALFATPHTNVVEEGTTATSINLLVGAGLGVAIVPKCSTLHFGPEVVVRPLAGRPARLPMHVAWRSDDDSEVVSELRDSLQRAARQEAAQPESAIRVDEAPPAEAAAIW